MLIKSCWGGGSGVRLVGCVRRVCDGRVAEDGAVVGVVERASLLGRLVLYTETQEARKAGSAMRRSPFDREGAVRATAQ